MEVAEPWAQAAVPQEEEQASVPCRRRCPRTCCTMPMCRDQGPTHLEALEALPWSPAWA